MVDQFGGRTPWPCHQFTTAVGTYSMKHSVCACCTESAFKRADTRVRGIGRQVYVTAFAAGSEIEHGDFSQLWNYKVFGEYGNDTQRQSFHGQGVARYLLTLGRF
jgi:hypothetical protein